MSRQVELTLSANGFVHVATAMDGATTNSSWADKATTISASRWVGTAADRARWPNITWDFAIAAEHPIFGLAAPIFYLFDYVHLIKKLRNVLDASGVALRDCSDSVKRDERGIPVKKKSVKAPRDLKWSKPNRPPNATPQESWEVLNLAMVERGTIGRGPGEAHCASYSNELNVAKYNHSHFHLTPAEKMKVSKAVAVFRAGPTIRATANRGLLTHQNRDLPSHLGYGALLDYLDAVNKLWNVCNVAMDQGNRYKAIRDWGDEQLDDLLDVLQHFSGWRNSLQDPALALTPDERTASFLPPETWKEVQSITLGLTCMARHYLQPPQIP